MEKKERRKNGRNSYLTPASAAIRLHLYAVSSLSLKYILNFNLFLKLNEFIDESQIDSQICFVKFPVFVYLGKILYVFLFVLVCFEQLVPFKVC